MSKFHPTSKANPCPSCGDVKGNCRHQDTGEIILCMTANSSRKGEIVDGGYKVIDFSQDGLWAILKPNDEQWSEEKKQQWANEQRHRREKSHREQSQRLAQLLPTSERDIQYRRIFASLGLNRKHRFSELSERRGLNTEEIDFAVSQGWLCSWQPGKEVQEVSPKLAGINPSGIKRSLLGINGIGIAAVDSTGSITGFQIASDNREKFGKYLWLSSASKNGNGPHLPSGELPIFVWRHPEAEQITETWLIEGGLKSLITVLKLWFRCGRKDIQVIGAAGGNFNGSIGVVLEALQGKVNLFPDAGSLSNAHILHQYKSTIEALTSKAHSVSVAWWGQVTKEDNDIDELKNFDGIQYISPDEFFAIAGSQLTAQEPKTENFKPTKLDKWKEEYEVKRSERAKFKFTRKANIEVKEGYLPTYLLHNLLAATIGIIGDWGIGKSHFTANICQQWKGKIIQVAHLNSILHNTAPKYGLMHHHEVKKLGLSLTSVSELAICDVTLAANFKPEAWAKGEDFILILDEICQLLKSLHTNLNLKGNLRVQARTKIEWLIRNATYILAADRDLDDETLEYLERVRGDGKKAFVIRHTGKKGKNHRPITINNNKHKDIVLSQLINDAKAGLKIGIACENKSDLLAIELSLKNAGLPEEIAFFAHGDNSNEPHIKPIIEAIDSQYTEYSILGYTMTMGTAVSLERQHFDKVYAFFTGDVLAASDQCQMLFRYRPDCDITIWVNPHRRNLEIEPENILEDLRIKTDETNNFIALIDDIERLHRQGIMPTARGKITADDLPFIQHKLSIISRINASRANPFQSLYDLLIDAGFTIKLQRTDTDEAVRTDEGQSHAEQKKVIKEESDRSIAESELMNEVEFQSATINAGNLRKSERDRLVKTKLHRDTGLEITQEIVKLQRTKGLLKGVRLLKVVLGDDATAVAYDLSDRERNPDIGDQSFYAVKRHLLCDLGIPQLLAKLKNGWSYTNNSPEIEEFGDKVRQRKADVKRLLGFTVSMERTSKGTFKMSSSALFGTVLNLLCVERESTKNRKEGNIYKLNTQHWEMLEAIMAHMDTQAHTPTLQGVIQKAEFEASSIINSQQSIVNSQNEINMNQKSTISNHQAIDEEWLTETSLQDLSELLGHCEDAEMLADLRAIAPASALKVASRNLPQEKKKAITQWVQAA